MIYLDRATIVLINRKTVDRHGGNFMPPENVLNPERLEFLVDMAQNDLYYSTVNQVAGFYFFSIIANHVFSDGNKRTGLEAMLLFLDVNGFELNLEKDEQLFDFTIKTASGENDFDACLEWIEKHTIKKL